MATDQTTTHTIKQGDTEPILQATLKGRDGAVQDLTDATVKFNMEKPGDGGTHVVVIDHAACVVTDAAAGTVEYHWTSGNTANTGTFKGEFEVTFADLNKLTFPDDHVGFTVKIVRQIA